MLLKLNKRRIPSALKTMKRLRELQNLLFPTSVWPLRSSWINVALVFGKVYGSLYHWFLKMQPTNRKEKGRLGMSWFFSC